MKKIGLMAVGTLCASAAFGDLADYVDPFVGTAGTGHTTPAACCPFGMVQAGPDTGNEDWHHCSCYVYGDKRIFGFSQTHLNGTGCPDLGDVLILPDATSDGLEYDKSSENAAPGWYAVALANGAKVEIAAAEHSAIYRITYSGVGPKRLLVDCQWGMVNKGEMSTRVRTCDVTRDGETGISGSMRIVRWVDRRLGFTVEFDHPCKSCAELPKRGNAPRYVFDFDLKPGEVLDVTGLIGQYVHGNEPSHHVIYFYPQIGQPEKAAERIREVFDKFYLPTPDGLCGNDDCGQMSAWYLFSAMGFYPFNPCGGEYVIGAPQVPRAEIEAGERDCRRTFRVLTKGLSKENKYVKSVALNGTPITDWKIRHGQIMAGGELVFEMGESLSGQPLL